MDRVANKQVTLRLISLIDGFEVVDAHDLRKDDVSVARLSMHEEGGSEEATHYLITKRGRQSS